MTATPVETTANNVNESTNPRCLSLLVLMDIPPGLSRSRAPLRQCGTRPSSHRPLSKGSCAGSACRRWRREGDRSCRRQAERPVQASTRHSEVVHAPAHHPPCPEMQPLPAPSPSQMSARTGSRSPTASWATTQARGSSQSTDSCWLYITGPAGRASEHRNHRQREDRPVHPSTGRVEHLRGLTLA